jgi:hypothetical protein
LTDDTTESSVVPEQDSEPVNVNVNVNVNLKGSTTSKGIVWRGKRIF